MRWLAWVLFVSGWVFPTVALATNVSGALSGNATWTPAGNPWVLTGDVTVPAGFTLTIEPGVQVNFAGFDDQGSGTDAGDVELIVAGTLNVQGTRASPVTLNAASAFGVVVQGSATFNYATIQGGTQCLRNSGNLSFTRGTLENCSLALVSLSGMSTITYSVVRYSGATSGYWHAIWLTGAGNIIHNTLTGNNPGAIRVDNVTGTVVNIYDNIIASNGQNGIYAPFATGGTRNIHHNDVWNHSVANYTNVTPGASSFSLDPRFVSSTNLELQESSGCRFSASDGTHMGAFAYGPVSYVDVTPSSSTLAVQGTKQFSATAYDSADHLIPNTDVTWTWAAAGAAGSINSSGLFTAGCTPGAYTAAVTGTASGKSSSVNVTLTRGTAATVNLSPAAATVPINGAQPFTAAVKDVCNNTLPAAPVSWSVASGGGSISSDGVFTAGTTPGTFTDTVVATSGSALGSATVTVTPGALASIDVVPTSATLSINGTQQFTAIGKDSAGNTVSATITWSVANGGGAIDGSGLFTAGTTPGTFTNTIKATSGAISGFATVTVQPGPLASIAVTPTSTTLSINGTQQFTATGKDSAGNTVPASITWSIVNGGGSINASGLFIAGTTPGTFTNSIQASSGALSGFATVTVQPGALASIELAPAIATLPIHGTQQFTATGKDSAGNTVPASITWSVVNGGGSIDASGLFTAGTVPGTFTNTLKATSGTLSSFATVTVQPGALASIELAPAATTLSIHATQQFTATGKDSAGNTVPVSVTWSVVNGGGFIDSTGLFTAGTTPGTYASTVQASSGTLSGFAGVIVQPGALASIEVTPATATLGVNGTQQFTATAKDSAGNTVPASITWSVVNGGGSINSAGLFTAGTAAGTFAQTLKASSGAVSATASVTVNPGPIQTVAVVPASVTLPAHTSRQFTATAADAWGNTVSGTPTWAVSPAPVGTIDATGSFTAGSTAGSYPAAVTATLSGITGSADVTISANSLATIVISPAAITLDPRGVRQFSAQGQDANGNIVPITPVWSVVNGAGSITQDGLFTATQAPGPYLDSVVATANGLTATASVTVVAGGIHRVTISPPNPTVSVKGTLPFSAKAFDAFDNELTQLTATWEIVNGGGTLDASGVFTAGTTSGVFANTVKVTLGGMSATTSVTVTTDFDGDGLSDEWEIANGLDPNQPGDGATDPDDDKLSNLAEFQAGTNPHDADTDDDGALDGDELSPSEDADGDGLPNARDPDSDNDGLFDGTEMAVSSPHANTDTSKGKFTADADTTTSTAPLLADTDSDGRMDGEEDANHNGKIDPGETDPNHADTFCSATLECGDGHACEDGVCVPDTHVPEDGGGCGCNDSGAGAPVFGLLLLSLLGSVSARRRKA